jgi:aconitate hydratase 2/2-methylisocitrate dehydratase
MTDVIHKVLMILLLMNGRLLLWVTLTQECQRVAFGADSGTVALALATGEASMPIPESVKVTFKGEMATYMDFHVVHATQSQMLKQFGGEMCSRAGIEVHLVR